MPSIQELIQEMNGDQEAVFKAERKLTTMAMAAGAPGNEDARNHLEAELAEALTARTKDEKGKEDWTHSVNARNRICLLLSFIGHETAVQPLSQDQMMGSLDVREMVRFALERNPTDRALGQLCCALHEFGPVFRTGAVNAMARRTDSDSAMRMLQWVAKSDEDFETRLAAAEALSRFPDVANDDLIYPFTQSRMKLARRRAHAARVRLAETLRDADKLDDARRIYAAVQLSDAPQAQRNAADIGLQSL